MTIAEWYYRVTTDELLDEIYGPPEDADEDADDDRA